MSTNKSIFEHTRKVTQQRFQNLKLLSGITMYLTVTEPRAIRRSINTERLDRVITSEKIGQKNTLKSIKSDQQNVQCGTV